MSSKDYDELEKIFTGSWKYDRDENLEEFFSAVEAPESMRQMFDVKPEVIFKRDGNSLKEKTIIAPGEEFDAVFRLNETLEWKEGDHFHVKVLPTFKDGAFIQEISPQLANGGKKHTVKTYVIGDELIGEMSLPEGSSVTAKRIYKKS